MAARKNGKEKREAANKHQPTEEQIRERAYEIYLARNGKPGSDLEDWLQAERELKAAVSDLTVG